MNKSKFLTVVVIALLISNGILFFMLAKEYLGKDGPRNIIIEKLHFDKMQVENYEGYIQQHRKAINDNEDAMNKLRSNLFEQLKYQQDSAKIEVLISFIAKQQCVAEKINYNHFLLIKNLCKPAQIKDFDDLTKDIASLFSSKERK
ncbi:MAG: hypothetical protein NTW54_02250 [Bacteroidetes bacterium]|nr:hypothetical protein [Bacteroidota bacterium]